MPALTPTASVTHDYWLARESVDGAFWDIDFLLFDLFLDLQQRRGAAGDLLEIGAWFGKSAILLGLHARAEDDVVICDVFDNPAAEDANSAENAGSYPGLTREKFEENYRTWVATPPRVIADFSQTLPDHVEPKTLRFAHVDGSHLYDVVQEDVRNVRSLLGDDGIVVLDDYRAMHTPGVAAATWAAVVNDGLIPVCLSEQKLYGTWSSGIADDLREAASDWVVSQGAALHHGRQHVAGHEVLLVANPRVKRTPRQFKHSVGAAIRQIRGVPSWPPYLGE